MSNYDTDATYAKVLSKTGLFSTAGRRNRKPFFFLNWGLNIIINAVANTGSAFALLLSLVCTYILFTNSVKRFHDLNKPDYYAAYVFLPLIIGFLGGNQSDWIILLIISFIIGIYQTFFKGTTGPNPYGPDPLEKV